ncbi:MAG: tetratricopeptide repeat protein [Pseudochelatococcus sp.]|uniref:tetratricopeptide repeat protein n=1 Tax=Pseudochelatococcus sp. TaxID=2020869 RepID=UPI003D931B91
MAFRSIARLAGVARFAVLAFALSGIGAAPSFARTSVIDDILPDYVPAETLDGNFLAAIIAGASRNTRAAAVYFREALANDPRNPELRERGFVAFLANGTLPEAVSLARDIARGDRNNGLAQLVLGVDALRKKQYVTARRFFNRGGRGQAADITATLLNAWSWAGSKNFPEAVGTVDNLTGESIYNVFRDFHAGLIATLLGSTRQGEERLRAAHGAEGTTLRVVDAFGRILSHRGKQDEAKAVYEKFDSLLPRHPVVRQALRELAAGRKLSPLVTTPQQGAAEVLYGLGAAGNGQGDEVAALIYLNLALHLDPDHALASMTRGDLLTRLKQHEAAIDAFDKVPAKSPLRTSADIQIAGALNALERHDDAIAYLKKVLERQPDDVDVLSALGGIQQARKLFTESAATYTRAIEQVSNPDSSHWMLYYFRGVAYERAKEWPKAEADLKKALELGGENMGSDRALVLNYLGYSWVDRNQNIDEAFDMLKRAVELKPRDGYIADSLAWAYYKLGRYEEAVKELERAIELKPSESVINDHLGDAYWRVGRRIEAVFQWNHARDLDPEPEELPRILDKIRNGLPDDKHGSTSDAAAPAKDDKVRKAEAAAKAGKEAAPAETAPKETAPKELTPREESPKPAENGPAGKPAVENPPAEDAPSEDGAPVESAPVESDPAGENPDR